MFAFRELVQAALLKLALLAFPAGLMHSAEASDPQVVLGSDGGGPPTGNVAYTLPIGRTFLLNVPAAYKHGEPHPLVLSFHGAGGHSGKQQRITQLSDPSLAIAGKPFLTAYGQGVNNTDWNMTHIWKGAPYENTTVDDIGYVFGMIETVASAYSVDRSRIYACGKSNGGGFTALLACRPDTSAAIAAFAPVSPALYQGTFAFHGCTPSRPVPILHVHGIQDPITPFYGRTPEEGSFGPEPDVRIWRRQWAERNGCAAAATHYPGDLARPARVREVHPGAWEELWPCPAADVAALSVQGLGHAWPSTLGLDRVGRPNHTTNFNLTHQHLVQFFSRYALPA